ncbi:SDR family NAD(P)-dependent oxidoreductase [Nocardia sp. NPDC046763]|uniref:SDR family NAD(P)-dependent oxidoreductase n=1 Tax=Nocardia sp. NPDC046763 TaxID=3155256 RepID=UPI003407A931
MNAWRAVPASAVATVKAVLPGMRERRGGHIFVITSMAGHTTFPGLAFYEGSKHALEGITDTLAQEVPPTLVVACPCWVGNLAGSGAYLAMGRGYGLCIDRKRISRSRSR